MGDDLRPIVGGPPILTDGLKCALLTNS
jgi:hypothetical protein